MLGLSLCWTAVGSQKKTQKNKRMEMNNQNMQFQLSLINLIVDTMKIMIYFHITNVTTLTTIVMRFLVFFAYFFSFVLCENKINTKIEQFHLDKQKKSFNK